MQGNGEAKTRRPVEREYLATLNAAVPLDKWHSICARAAEDAAAGDAKARDWLSKWLLGLESRLLTTLAAEETETTTAGAANQEIFMRKQSIDVERRDAEQNRLLLQAMYS